MSTIHPTTRVAADLTEIVELSLHLHTQAAHKSRDRLMPGGYAMVSLAHVANLEAWERRYEAAESNGRPTEHVEDEDDSWEPPLQTLCFWSEQWRAIHGAEYDKRATIASEASFIRWALEWAWNNEPRWEDFANDIHAARTRLENVLSAGHRDIISDDVACLVCGTELRRRATRSGYEDEWWCIDCHHHLTAAQFNLAASEAARRNLGLA